MTEKRNVTDPYVPKPGQCPRCGHTVFLGDVTCDNCGYNLETLEQAFKSQPPNIVAGGGFVIGVVLGLAALGMDGVAQIIVLVIAFGCVVGGGLFYAAHLFLTSDNRRKKPGKNSRNLF